MAYQGYESIMRRAGRLWHRLTEPYASVTEPNARQHSQFLSSLLLIAITALCLLMLMFVQSAALITNPGLWLVACTIMIALTLIAYHLSRLGRTQLASGIALALAIPGVFIPALMVGGQSGYTSLFYLLATTVCASVFLSMRAAIAVTLAQLAGLLALGSSFPGLTLAEVIIGPFTFNLVTSTLVLLVTHYRQRIVRERQSALTASEERYRIITELISDYAYYYRLNPDGTRTREWITDSFTRLTGYTAEEVPQPTGDNFIHPEDRAAAEGDRERVAQGEIVSSEFRIFTKKGEQRWLRIHRHPAWDETHTHVIGSYGVAQDITTRKQAEIALKESEERYRIITELISDYAYSLKIAPDGTLLHDWITEASFLRATGYAHQELDEGEKVSLTLFHPHEEPSLHVELESTLRNEATHGEHRIITKSGETRWVHLYRRPVWDEQEGRVIRIYGVAQDVTARKLADIALKRSEERYRIISELISDYAYYFRIDPDGARVREWVTDSLLHVTGYTPEELPAGAEVKMFHPDDVQNAVEDRQRILKGESVSGEYRIVRKNGEQRWLNIRRRPVWDESQKRVIGYHGVAQDITARKQAETQKMRMALEQEQRLMVNQFMQALSHDFRTLLATIETSRYLIERLLDEAARQKVQTKLNTIQQSVNHLASQLENLHMVSSLTAPHPASCDLNRLIESIIAEQTLKALQKQVSLHFEPDRQLPLMHIDDAKIEQALQHLVTNALTYTPQQGTVTLRTRRNHTQTIIEVQDTGSGIDPAVLPHIFEPFYRGDEARTVDRGGVGLGLTIVKMTVEAHGGSIQVESQAGVGTMFSIQLPLVALDTQLAV